MGRLPRHRDHLASRRARSASPHSFPNHGAHRVCVARYAASDGTLGGPRPGAAVASETDRFILEPAAQDVSGWGPNRAFRMPWGAPLREDERQGSGRGSMAAGRMWRRIAGVNRDQICSMYKHAVQGRHARPGAMGVPTIFTVTTLFRFVDERRMDLTQDASGRRRRRVGDGDRQLVRPRRPAMGPEEEMSPLLIRVARRRLARVSYYLHGCLHACRRTTWNELIDQGFVEHSALLVVHPMDPNASMEVASAPRHGSEAPYELHLLSTRTGGPCYVPAGRR